MAFPIFVITLSNCLPHMYTPGSCISISGNLHHILASAHGPGGNRTLTVQRTDMFGAFAEAEGISHQPGQGTSKVCATCSMAMVCGYLDKPIPFYFCPVCRRIYVQTVTGWDGDTAKTKQILIKKECPVRAVLDLKQPCQRCMNRNKLNRVKRKQQRENNRSRNKQAMKGGKR